MSGIALYEAGYSDLVLIRRKTKAPARKGWLHNRPTRQQVARWNGPIGVIAQEFPGIDIDVEDETLSRRVAKVALRVLGPAPLRLSAHPASKLLVYRTETPFAKKVLTLPNDLGKIEVLGSGRQYLAYGDHPDGPPHYRWANAPLWEIPPHNLTSVTEAQVDAFLASLQEELGGFIGRKRETADTVIPPENLRAPSLEHVEEALALMPNTNAFLADVLPEMAGPRDYWVAIGHAVKGAAGDAGENAFVEWTSKWVDGPVDLDNAREVYQGLRPERYGWPTLDRILRDFCRPDATEEFEAEEAPPLAILAPLNTAIRSLGRSWSAETLLTKVAQARESMSTLSPQDQQRFEPFVVAQINRVLGSLALAQQVWKAAGVAYSPGTDVVNGRRVIYPADPTEIDWATTYLVYDLIPVGSVVEVNADYSTGKTMLLLDAALSVTFGEPFMGREVVPGRVLYLAYEGQIALWQRIATWLHYHGYVGESVTMADVKARLEGRFLVAKKPPHFDDATLEHLLHDTIEIHDLDLVVIDTRAKSLGRSQGEDSADTAAHVQSVLSGLAQDLGCSFLSAHHVGHADKSRGRGSSAWTQGADASFVIDGTAAAFARGDAMILRPTKFRDDRWPGRIEYRLRDGIRFLLEGRDYSGAVIEGVGPAIELPVRTKVFERVRSLPSCTKQAVRDAVTGSNASIDGALDSLLSIGAVVDAPKGNGHRYSVVAGWRIGSNGEIAHAADDFDADDAEPESPR